MPSLNGCWPVDGGLRAIKGQGTYFEIVLSSNKDFFSQSGVSGVGDGSVIIN